MKFYVTTAVLMLAVLLACTATEERKPIGSLTEAPYFASYDEAVAEAGRLDRPVLLDFYTDW